MGPGTAGLALAECLKQPTVRYLGLDIAKAIEAQGDLNAPGCD